VPSTITGEPICADYSIGAGGEKLRGALRFPVRVTILDGKKAIMKVLVFGKRHESDSNPRVVLPDQNAEYQVEWAQCVNERATAAVSSTKAKSLRSDGLTTYDCGEAKAYKTAPLVTKKGDHASHALVFEVPPAPDCWMDAKPEAVADAGTPDAASAGTDVADAGDMDASMMDDAAAAGDADVMDAGAADASTGKAEPTKESGNKPVNKASDKPVVKPVDKPADVRADTPTR
jgi:hypothetical protein